MNELAPLPVASAPEGEQLGAMLIGLVQSLRNVQAISGEQAAQLVADIRSDAWYPMSIFFGILDEILAFEIDPGPILFQAGIAFIQDWFTKFDGHTVFPTAKDFILAQAQNGGYAQVHRGSPDKIGWLDLLDLDESAGSATVVCVTPYPKEFERGLFFCGVRMAGEVDYVHVDSVEEPYNQHLSKKTVMIRYHRSPSPATRDALDALLASMSPATPVSLPGHLHDAVTWRLKATQEEHSNDRLFYEQSSLLLSKAASRIYDLSQRLDKLAHHDELTDLLNRRAIFERAEHLLAAAARHNWPMSFIMLDIDHFKSINDIWGHSAGDDILRSIATVLKKRLRDPDLLGRVGGEEFLVVLPETNLESARALAENLRTAVEQHTVRVVGTERISVTISLGIAIVDNPQPGEIDKYIKQADSALYHSKHTGRNRVTISSS